MNDKRRSHLCSRREFLAAGSVAAVAAVPGVSTGGERWRWNGSPRTPAAALPKVANGNATSCIFIWLGGGACQLDTWDPKRIGDPTRGSQQPGSAYPAIPTAIDSIQVCEHLHRVADRLDSGAIVRSVHHDVIDEHAAATNRMHVGRPPTGTTVYPSIGSVVAQQLDQQDSLIPPYILMGYPSATRGPGFLGGRYGYLYLTDTQSGPRGLRRPDDVSDARQARREGLLEELATDYLNEQQQARRIEEYVEANRAALRLASPEFLNVFDLSSEPATRREGYGGEFGQRCLLARRLAQEGVKFSEVAFNLNFLNGTGWDTHNQGQAQQHVLIQQLDQALSALIDDLKRVERFDETLIVVATEFGRPPEFDGGGGRGHQSRAFSVALFGGGLSLGQAIGATDEFGREVIDRPISIPDLHATIYQAMGISPDTILYDEDRPVPITDGGTPIAELFR